MHNTTTKAAYHPDVIFTEEEIAANGGSCWEIIRRNYHRCPTCTRLVHNDDTETICDPKTIREVAAWNRKEAKKAAIRKRMEEREAKFREAQSRDEYAIYLIDHDRGR
jgi:hypothetical protein